MDPFIAKKIHPHIVKEYDLQLKKTKNIRSVIKVESQLGKFAIKKTNMSYTQIRRMNEVLQFLAERQFPVSPIVSNKFGDIYVPADDGIIYVTKWVEANPLTLNHHPHLLSVITMMASLHKLGFSFTPKTLDYHYVDELYIRHSWEERINWIKKYHKKLKRKTSLTTFEHIFLTHIPFLKEWAEEALEHLNQWMIQYDSIGKMRKTICHGRIHHRNTIITPNEKMFLLDFEHVSLDTPVRDIAYFIRHYILNKEHRNWAKQWISAYQKIVPLSLPETKLLAIYLLFPERMLTLAKRYDQREKDWSEDVYLKKLQIRWEQMKEMIWFIDQHQWLNE